MFFIKKTTILIFFIIKTKGYNYTPGILRKPCHFRLTYTAGKGSAYRGFRCQSVARRAYLLALKLMG